MPKTMYLCNTDRLQGQKKRLTMRKIKIYSVKHYRSEISSREVDLEIKFDGGIYGMICNEIPTGQRD